jgi:hypothetical protein
MTNFIEIHFAILLGENGDIEGDKILSLKELKNAARLAFAIAGFGDETISSAKSISRGFPENIGEGYIRYIRDHQDSPKKVKIRRSRAKSKNLAP